MSRDVSGVRIVYQFRVGVSSSGWLLHQASEHLHTKCNKMVRTIITSIVITIKIIFTLHVTEIDTINKSLWLCGCENLQVTTTRK